MSDIERAEQFARAYAERSGMTVAQLDLFTCGRREVQRCDCGEPDCEGWGMGYIEWRGPMQEPGIPLSALWGPL